MVKRIAIKIWGMSGDQTLSRFNKRLAESIEQEIEVHLFEVEKATEYIYRGKVSLASEPYQVEQKGSDGNLRKVWMFPLALQSSDQTIDLEFIKKLQEKEDRKAVKMSGEDLYKKARENERKKVLQYKTTNTIYFRDAYVSEYAKRRANGKCQLCGEVAPFQNKYGKLYQETHHIIWLSQGGPDTIDNTVALCPNCHRKMHVLNLEEDQEHIKEVMSDDDKN